MKKSTRKIIIGIGTLSILSGIYGILSKGELYEIIFAFFIGSSLIGATYFDKKSPD